MPTAPREGAVTNRVLPDPLMCLHPTGLRCNNMILHTFVNQGLSASATQKQDGVSAAFSPVEVSVHQKSIGNASRTNMVRRHRLTTDVCCVAWMCCMSSSIRLSLLRIIRTVRTYSSAHMSSMDSGALHDKQYTMIMISVCD